MSGVAGPPRHIWRNVIPCLPACRKSHVLSRPERCQLLRKGWAWAGVERRRCRQDVLRPASILTRHLAFRQAGIRWSRRFCPLSRRGTGIAAKRPRPSGRCGCRRVSSSPGHIACLPSPGSCGPPGFVGPLGRGCESSPPICGVAASRSAPRLLDRFADACARFPCYEWGCGSAECEERESSTRVPSVSAIRISLFVPYIMHTAKNTPYNGTGTKRSASRLGPTQKPQIQNRTASSPEK